MKRLYILILVALTLGLSSCKNFLDTMPGDKYDDATVWANPNLVEKFIMGIYTNIPYPFQWYMSGSLVDEQTPFQSDGIVNRVLESNLTPDELGIFANNWAFSMQGWWWKSAYDQIRACNKVLVNISKTDATQAVKDRFVAEAHFLRGYMYYMLMTQYGGVPLLDKLVNLGDDYNIPRATFDQTIKFIVDDFDAAISDGKLDSQTDKTRATKGAALALKSRVLLYAASEMHHDLSWAAGYSNPELIGYPNSNATLRDKLYTDAKTAAEECMGLGYSLYDAVADKSENFHNIFSKPDLSTCEQIFNTNFDVKNWGFYGTNWLILYDPFGGSHLSPVIASMANAYENSDGTPFNFEAQKANPYQNRDPRFDGSVLHNGSAWIDYWAPRTVDLTELTADGTVLTGYWIKKFTDRSKIDYYYGSFHGYPYIQIRYAEVLLNYAEACLGLRDEASAKIKLNDIRTRAGMGAITDTGAALIKRYRNERRVELAFEGHRLWDVRRWLIGSEAYVNGTGVKYAAGTGYSEAKFDTRAWKNSHNLIPIPRSEIYKNPTLIQNPGY